MDLDERLAPLLGHDPQHLVEPSGQDVGRLVRLICGCSPRDEEVETGWDLLVRVDDQLLDRVYLTRASASDFEPFGQEVEVRVQVHPVLLLHENVHDHIDAQLHRYFLSIGHGLWLGNAKSIS